MHLYMLIFFLIQHLYLGRLQPAHLVQPRGATPCPRSGAEARRNPCPRGGGQEELPHVLGQGQRPRVPGCDGARMAKRSYPTSEVRGGGWEELLHVQGQGQWQGGATPCLRPGTAAERSYPRLRPGAVARRTYPIPKARGGCGEKQPHLQGAVAAGAQEGLEELFHVQGQKGWQ